MADEASQAPRKTYRGNCHCGAYVYEVELPEITSVAACNCSICSKKGYLFVFVGDDDKFSVVKGDGALKGYGFGGGVYTHQVTLRRRRKRFHLRRRQADEKGACSSAPSVGRASRSRWPVLTVPSNVPSMYVWEGALARHELTARGLP